MTKRFEIICTLLVFASHLSVPALGDTVVIDFEDIASGTLIRDQFLADGLEVTGAGGFSGLVYSEGDYGVLNFGNSPTQIMDIGNRGAPTTLTFVDPSDPDTTIGTTEFSILMGDGNPDQETFTVAYFDVDGVALSAPLQFTTMTDGVFVSATSTDLGGRIGSVVLTVIPGSSSGAVADDISFIPEPSGWLLLGAGAGVLVVLRRVSRRGSRASGDLVPRQREALRRRLSCISVS